MANILGHMSQVFVLCICLLTLVIELGAIEDYSDLRAAVLAEINKLRAIHQAAPLALDDDLSQGAEEMAAKHAQSYAEKAKFAQRPANDAYGDAVSITITSKNTKPSAKKIMEEWAKQKELYDWNNMKKNFNNKIGGFAQMVWKSSESLGVGMGMAKNPQNQFVTVVVVRYSPAGNVWEEESFRENILPAKTG